MDGPIEVEGPFNISGIAMTPSREKIFVCYPAAASEQASCARTITGKSREARVQQADHG